nr:rhodanese-related sulfurtransferase [uncultured Sphingomonas sp.]
MNDTIMDNVPNLTVAALYCFAPFADCEAIRASVDHVCRAQDIRGTLLIAPEGINGTIAGSFERIAAVLAFIRGLDGCADLNVNYSDAVEMPFHRMKVRIKREIVTMGEANLDPAQNAGFYVAPEDWNALISDQDTIIIDTRNDYEVTVGSFAGALNPDTQSFRDFPAWFRSVRDTLFEGREKPRVAMFCTGGIRCEKSTAFLKQEGVEDVYHLKGGILNYLQQVPEEESLWQGECFVFDERVAIGHGLKRGTHSLCRACRKPLSPQDTKSPQYEEGVSCGACYPSRTDDQRASYRERVRQEALALKKGRRHVGATRADQTERD